MTTLAIWLLIAPISVRSSAETLPAEQLPNGSAFREKMLTWLPEAVAPETLPRRIVQKEGPVPATLPRLSSGFGYRSDPFAGTSRRHSGIDIPGAHGTRVLASGDGVVSFAGTAGSYGNMIEIDHGGGLTTRYAHLSRIFARRHTPVTRGETIALIGSTGRSTGPHLHFEVRHDGRAANPLDYFGGSASVTTSHFVWSARTQPHISQFARARAASQ